MHLKTSWRCRNDVCLYVPATSQARLKWNTNDISVERRQDVSVVRVHDVPLVRLYCVFCISQMKYPMTSLWYVSTMCRSYVVVMSLLRSLQCFQITCHDLHLVGFHVSFKHQIKHHIFLVPTRRETRGVVWIIN